MKRLFTCGLSALLLCACPILIEGYGAVQILDNHTHHLGVVDRPEWDIFAGKTPEGTNLHLIFESHRNAREYTLFIRQDDVKQEWPVTLNGHKLGQLFLMEADLVHSLAVPPELLRDGRNDLEISAKMMEDILIHNIALGDDTKEKLLTAGPANVTVRDSASGEALPSRITIVDQTGSLVPIFDYGQTNLATRPGVIYTGTGNARFQLLPGKYTVYATRGPEYAMAMAKDFEPEKDTKLKLTIERQANTRGWVACDTHIHTLALSKHGDALLPERVITLAGEGIELPISTEHNLHADYQPTIDTLGLGKYLTLVRGNEVTTAKGHFNIFPIETSAKPPDAKVESWPELLKQIRATPQVEVAILNHPTDMHSGFTPFATTNLNLITGRNLRGDFDFTFDAMELINSGAMRSQWSEVFVAWFALLNRGYKIVGVGASDSHDVSRFIVGQGRTYIRVDDSDVSHIDIRKACQNLQQGHALVSLGLIAQMSISDSMKERAGPGDLLSARGDELELNMTVEAPLAPGKSPFLTICDNGQPHTEFFAAPADQTGFRTTVTKNIPKPRHDTYYVLIAEISADPAPYWGLARPYQPTSKHFDLKLIGATNPIWVDADGDGRFTSAREYASLLVQKYGGSLPDLFSKLSEYDYYVAAHCAELLKNRGQDLRSPEIASLLEKARPEVQNGFRDYERAEKP